MRTAPSSQETPDHPPSPPVGLPARLLVRLAELQVTRPAIPLFVVGALTVLSLLCALRLKILTGFESLLPDTRPSVLELKRVAEKTAGVSTLFVVLQGGPDTPTPALRKAADALVPAIEQLGSPWVGSVEDGVHEAVAYLGPRAGLFASRAGLQKLGDDIDARYEYEVAKQTDLLLDEHAAPPPAIDAARLKADFGLTDEDALHRYPDGYYQSRDGKTLVVAVRSKVLGSDIKNGTEAIRRVREAVARVRPASFDAAITVGFAGDLQTGISEYSSINRDLTAVGTTGAVLIAAVVFLYYLRFRTLFSMLITISIGVAWTFGFTSLTIGHLNLATGFLFTIIAGNGINFSFIYMQRFLEARRRGATLLEGVLLAHRETWPATLTAVFAAGAAYGSLLVTEFRGFHDFGVIGSVGMLFCWIATYVSLPCILSLIERLSPIEHTHAAPQKASLIARIRHATQGGVAFGRPFAAIVPLAPRALTVGGIGLAVLGFVATVGYVKADPMEYDLKNLRNDPSARAEEIRLTKLAEDITGYVGSDGMAILVDRVEQVAPLRDALYRVRDAAPPDAQPFRDVHALEDLIPTDQVAKIPILLAIKDKMVRAHRRRAMSDADWKKIEAFLPPDDLTPYGMADVPTGVARAFTETDGTRGRIVYISPISAEVVDDAHYLFRWADAYRATKLPDGTLIRGSGRAVIYADMMAAVVDDVPPAVAFSLALTVLVTFVAFRVGRAALAVLASLIVGVGWMAGLLVLMKVKLNFLNFIALPITFGIGVDYAVNIVQRYVREGAGGAVTAVKETGGAVILCSLTTTLGYLALVRSMNYAVRSLGIAAVLGELSCVCAAVLVLPAALLWLDQHLPAGARSSLTSIAPPKAKRV